MFTFAPFSGREGDPGRSGRHASPGHYENADGIRNAAAKRGRNMVLSRDSGRSKNLKGQTVIHFPNARPPSYLLLTLVRNPIVVWETCTSLTF